MYYRLKNKLSNPTGGNANEIRNIVSFKKIN